MEPFTGTLNPEPLPFTSVTGSIDCMDVVVREQSLLIFGTAAIFQGRLGSWALGV